LQSCPATTRYLCSGALIDCAVTEPARTLTSEHTDRGVGDLSAPLRRMVFATSSEHFHLRLGPAQLRARLLASPPEKATAKKRFVQDIEDVRCCNGLLKG
jgi:hypothetical protein